MTAIYHPMRKAPTGFGSQSPFKPGPQKGYLLPDKDSQMRPLIGQGSTKIGGGFGDPVVSSADFFPVSETAVLHGLRLLIVLEVTDLPGAAVHDLLQRAAGLATPHPG